MGADVMHRGRTDREAGFGMIEVLIAVALYAIALVSLFGLLIPSVTAGTIGESSAVAVNLARQRIEGLTALDVPMLLAQGCGTTVTAQVPAGQGRVYTLTVNCSNQPAYVDVTVTAGGAGQGARVAGGRQYSRVFHPRPEIRPLHERASVRAAGRAAGDGPDGPGHAGVGHEPPAGLPGRDGHRAGHRPRRLQRGAPGSRGRRPAAVAGDGLHRAGCPQR